MTRLGYVACLSIATLLGTLSLSAQSRPPAYSAGPVENGSTLTGQVVFEGTVPRSHRFFITKDVEVCGMGYRERKDVELGDGGGLRNVVVTVVGIEEGKPWPGATRPFELSQEECRFTPHVMVIPRGRDLRVLNPDPVLHNIHAFELMGDASRTLFNFGQPPEQPVITHAIRPRRGNRIRVECDAHDFMLGWIYAADHPYTVAVDADGRFEIGDVPPGSYTIRAWHPYLGVLEQEVSIAPGGADDIVFRFAAQ